MKKSMLYLFVLVIMLSSSFTIDSFKVFPDFSDKQIRKIEEQVLKEFKIKVTIEVIKRNTTEDIVHLICKRYDLNGNPKSSCESDNFGELEITDRGCKIADLTSK